MEAKALHDFKATAADELSFTKGAIVKVRCPLLPSPPASALPGAPPLEPLAHHIPRSSFSRRWSPPTYAFPSVSRE